MTRKEAIKHLERWLDERMWRCFGEEDRKAIRMAIESLSVEIKGDLISRQWLLDLYVIPKNGNGVKWKVPLEVVRQNILDAPSAEAVPLSVVDKIGEECERLDDKVAELEEQLADTVSREDYHNLLMASKDIDRALREYQAKEEQLSAEARPYCVLEPRLPFRKPKTWHEKNGHTYICGDCGFEQAIYGNIDEYNCCPRCGVYKEYVDYGCMFPQKRTPYREDGEE